MAITLRSVKASALTHNELDDNFTTLVAADVVLTDAVALNTARTQVVEAASTASTVAGGIWVSDGAGGGEFIRVQGWAQNADSRTTVGTPTQVLTTGVQATIINDGGTLDLEKLPSDIGVGGQLWDKTNSKLTPIALFDTYNLRFDWKVQNYSGATPYLLIELDIGGTIGVIASRTVSLIKGGAEQSISLAFPVFAGSTMVTNGATLKCTYVGTGTCDVFATSNLVVRESKNYA